MAVAFDAVGPSSAGASSSASTTLSWTHTNVGASCALFVAIAVGAEPDTGFSVTVKLDPAGANTPFTSLGSIVHSNAGTAGFIALFGLPGVTSGGHTITATVAGGTPSTIEGGSLSYTGADTVTPFSAQQSATGLSTTPSKTFTGSTSGNMVAGAVANGSTISSMTAGTSRWIVNVENLTGAGNEGGGHIAGGGSVTFTWSVTSDSWAVAAVEVLAAAAAGGIPYSPPRLPQIRNVSTSYWLQDDRREALLVSTAANPLVAPLDSAWQAGARYWHTYNDWGSRRFYPQQRTATAGSAAAAVVAIPGPVPLTPWRRDQYPPQQRQLESPPDLLATALLEDALLGGAETDKRTNVPATHADRRLVPQYTLRESAPDLLDTALLEVPGNPDAVTLTAVTHLRAPWLRQKPTLADQSSAPGAPDFDPIQAGYGRAWRWRRDPYPAVQRQLESLPGLLDTALLENELLGGAGTWMRAALAATHVDRRQVPQQRQYLVDVSVTPVDADPILLAWLPLWQKENRAATHVDRRLVPLQRPYISDPSFYPTVPPADPLTLAWGAGGPLWHLYNDSALRDRRQVPQQRSYWVEIPAETDPTLSGWSSSWRTRNVAPYISGRLVPQQPKRESDPNLLLSALLEDVLLGGADDLARHRAWYTDRRLIPQQRVGYDVPGLPADPLLIVGADWRRKLTPATHAERWALRLQIRYLEYIGSLVQPAPDVRYPVLIITPNLAGLVITPNQANLG